FAPQQRAAAVRQTQAAEAIEIDFRQATGDQLAEYRTPILLAQLLADTVGGQVLVTSGADLLVVPAEQDVHQVPDAIALAAAIDGGQRHARGFAAVPGRYRLLTVVAIAAGLLEDVAEVAQQRLASAGRDLAQREHGIELVSLDTLVSFVALGIGHDLVEHEHVLQTVGHPGIGRQTIATGAAGFLVVGL